MKNLAKTLLVGLSLTALSAAVIPAQANSARSPLTVEMRSDTPLALAEPTLSAPSPAVFTSADASSTTIKAGTQLASFNTSCADPSPWYTFSGWEALTCVFSGQW